MERTKLPSVKKGALYSVQDEPLLLSKFVLDKFLEEQHPSDLISLYSFYYYTAKWQHTDCPKAVIEFVAKGLRWSERRVQRAKKILKELNLIEDVTTKDEKNKVTGHFVKVNLYCTDQRPTRNDSQAVGFTPTNALVTNNKKGFTEFLAKFPDDWKHDKNLQKALKEFYLHRKEKGKKLTPLSENKLVKKLTSYDISIVIQALDRSVENGWTGVFPESITKEENNKPPIYDDGIKYVWDPKISRYKHSITGEIYVP